MQYTDEIPWYSDVSRYQWLALVIASLGWVFDVFEGQIFVSCMNEAMPSLLPDTPREDIGFYTNVTVAAFLLGGALGGIVFGMVSDRIGRTKTMIATILVYSLFTCVSAYARTWWQLAVLRFLVALGVGGEWAVATALVAEVFPRAARARSLGIFHASSVLGTYLAIAAGVWLVNNPRFGWRGAFVIGAAPALLTLFIRWSLHEPESWQDARRAASQGTGDKLGRFTELFSDGRWRHTLVGVGLAAVGLATFWGVHIYGKDLMRHEREYAFELQMAAGNPAHVPMGAWEYWSGRRSEAVVETDADAVAYLRDTDQEQIEYWLASYYPQMKSWEMFGMLLVTTGGGLGLLSFGPLCEKIGRRTTFLFFLLGGLATTLLVFGLPRGWTLVSDLLLVVLLGGFGFLTLGMHAGFAIYFPELFPTRLRATGGGFCFNFGRVLAGPLLVANGWIQKQFQISVEQTCLLLSSLFLIGVVLLYFAPETKDRELPEA
ncbi:MAG TPA: MFS transporter [Pirellulales bacterium]|nr:MFS transporter [Pirellulales bacterium]